MERACNSKDAQFQAEQGQAVAEGLLDQTLQELVTLRTRVEAMEAETARMLAFSVEKEKKESAKKNAPSPMLRISEER